MILPPDWQSAKGMRREEAALHIILGLWAGVTTIVCLACCQYVYSLVYMYNAHNALPASQPNSKRRSAQSVAIMKATFDAAAGCLKAKKVLPKTSPWRQ